MGGKRLEMMRKHGCQRTSLTASAATDVPMKYLLNRAERRGIAGRRRGPPHCPRAFAPEQTFHRTEAPHSDAGSTHRRPGCREAAAAGPCRCPGDKRDVRAYRAAAAVAAHCA